MPREFIPTNTSSQASGISYNHESLLSRKTLDPLHERKSQHRLLTGWRFRALISLIGAATVCLFNVVVTVWVWKNPKHELDGSISTLYKGSCDEAKDLDLWLHLLINILSTLLLGASNYCMQVLSAPNREELVQAHLQKKWLHIGVPSIRNLFRIGKDRAFLWLLFVLSSVPLHLLFNSVVFTTL